MRFALNARWRTLRRIRLYTGFELALLFLLSVQLARLAWTLATPLTLLGPWQVRLPQAAPGVSPTVLASFDPFFRLARSSGPTVVTALDINLHGVRDDLASGRGAAIISTGDGQQRSFTIGEEIMPGVRLTDVDFDHVTIDRSGVSEQLFLAQPSASSAVPAATEATETGQ